DAITLLVNVLQVEAVNYVVSDGAAVQQIDEQSSRGSPAPQQAGETTESRQPTHRMTGKCREHSCARRRLLRRHQTGHRLIALGNKESDGPAQNQSHGGHPGQPASMVPKQVRI